MRKILQPTGWLRMIGTLYKKKTKRWMLQKMRLDGSLGWVKREAVK